MQTALTLHVQVPGVLFGMPVAALGGVLLLNALNLPPSMHNATRFKSNLALMFVVGVAFCTDLMIYLHLTPVVAAGNGRL